MFGAFKASPVSFVGLLWYVSSSFVIRLPSLTRFVLGFDTKKEVTLAHVQDPQDESSPETEGSRWSDCRSAVQWSCLLLSRECSLRLMKKAPMETEAGRGAA